MGMILLTQLSWASSIDGGGHDNGGGGGDDDDDDDDGDGDGGGGVAMDSSSDVGSSESGGLVGVHSLVASLYGLQGERSRLRGELRLLHSQLEEKEQDRHSRILDFQQQVGVMLSISSSAFHWLCTCTLHMTIKLNQIVNILS